MYRGGCRGTLGGKCSISCRANFQSSGLLWRLSIGDRRCSSRLYDFNSKFSRPTGEAHAGLPLVPPVKKHGGTPVLWFLPCWKHGGTPGYQGDYWRKASRGAYRSAASQALDRNSTTRVFLVMLDFPLEKGRLMSCVSRWMQRYIRGESAQFRGANFQSSDLL